MELNRNQYFLMGLVILALGIQLRLVDSYILNQASSKFLAGRLGTPKQQAGAEALPLLDIASTGATESLRRVRPPVWLGWALISISAVLILHSLAMKKPD